jgi:hypothetical protein
MRWALVGFGGVGVLSLLACGGALGGLGDGAPLYGTGSFSGGLTEVEVRAGGDTEAKTVIGVPMSCVGFIAPEQPDYTFSVASPGGLLNIGACSDQDTALVIRPPSGTIACIADSEGTNPVYTENASAMGDYAVWVATYSSGGSASAKLRITDTNDSVCTRIAFDGEPSVPPIALSGGFAPQSVPVQAGGSSSASGLRNATGNCTGYVDDTTPTARINFTGASGPLNIGACSGSDTTLIVRGPDGTTLCNDDTEGSNPVVRIPAAGAGDYTVLVGAYSSGERPSATLKVSSAGGSLCSTPVVK